MIAKGESRTTFTKVPVLMTKNHPTPFREEEEEEEEEMGAKFKAL